MTEFVSEPGIIRVRVDPTNPGQFFACCGLLELADRLWPGAEGWFERQAQYFSIKLAGTNAAGCCVERQLLDYLVLNKINNVMTEKQIARYDELAAMSKKERESDPDLEAEKKVLDSLWREAPLMIGDAVVSRAIRIDWFADEHSGGAIFKTWAGQQSVYQIATGMQTALMAAIDQLNDPLEWVQYATITEGLPFNFDAALGGAGSPRDLGFSLDPLKEIKMTTRPLLELAAFIGLQRFRPLRMGRGNRFRYTCWHSPLVPELAALAGSGQLDVFRLGTYEFSLLYRTKYLKSFLPARPVWRESCLS